MSAVQEEIDVLQELLILSQQSVFRRVSEDVSHLRSASTEARKAILYIAAADARRAEELWRRIEQLGGHPRFHGPPMSQQHVAYLSLTYLLNLLASAKDATLGEYRNSLAGTGNVIGPLSELVRRQLSEHAGERIILQQLIDAVSEK